MPTYEYLCNECQHRFDSFQYMSEAPLETCPQCGGKVKRLISGGGGLLFKGSGFYETDYRSSEYKAKAAEEKKTSTTTKSTSSND